MNFVRTRTGKPINKLVRAFNGGAAKHINYQSFAKMKQRCYDPKSNRYNSYGARGIIVCDRWMEPQGFWNFVEDLGVRPSKAYSLDRIDVNGNYSPENCRWATPHQQSANRRRNNKIVGVSWNTHAKKWMAQIMVRREKFYLGLFSEYEDAVKARKYAEERHAIR